MTEPDAPEEEYNDSVVAMRELIWGEGFLSPGGPEAVNRIVAGLDLADKLVIDVGCGACTLRHQALSRRRKSSRAEPPTE